MRRPRAHHAMLVLWAIGALTLLAAYAQQWGPGPTSDGELLLHLAASGVETLAVVLLLRVRKHALTANLLALVSACLVTVFWATRATPSGSGADVTHIIWLMLVLVVLAGRLGWDLFVRILERPRRA